MSIIFDIETGPLPDDILRRFYEPPKPPKHPGEFDESSVKLGRMKDPEKIKEKRDDAREAHRKTVEAYEQKLKTQDDEAWQAFKGRAALEATTCQVLAIGYHNFSAMSIQLNDLFSQSREKELLCGFWKKAEQCREGNRRMIGLNIWNFDLPVLMRRSWIHRIEVPDWVQTAATGYRYFDRLFVDIRKRWQCGQRDTDCKSNFNHLAATFETGGKTDGVDGSQFADLLKTDLDKAIEYLTNDVEGMVEWCNAMGVS